MIEDHKKLRDYMQYRNSSKFDFDVASKIEEFKEGEGVINALSAKALMAYRNEFYLAAISATTPRVDTWESMKDYFLLMLKQTAIDSVENEHRYEHGANANYEHVSNANNGRTGPPEN